MELRQLEYFVTAAREGTISQAARTLYLAQPSLSAQIRKLERELGSPLFARLGRRLALTPAGETFLPFAETVLATVREGKQQVKRTIALHAGRIRLGALPSIDAALLPKLLREFGALQPEIEVLVHEADVASQFETLVHRGDLDLAIKRLPCQREDLESRLLVREPIILFVPPGHRLASQTSVSVGALVGESFVTMKEGHGLRSHLFALCRAAGFEPRISFETAQLDSVREMVLAGRGLAMMPRMLATNAVPWLLLDSPDAYREIGVIWKPGRAFPPAAKIFLDFLVCATEPMRPD